MNLDGLWTLKQQGGYPALKGCVEAPGGLEQLFVALHAFAEGDLPEALRRSRLASQAEPTSRLFAQATRYLERVVAQGKQDVYVQGEAFGAFIRGGGNVGLYQQVSSALRAIYLERPIGRLLDIGVGDGLALLPAWTDSIGSLTLVEPSEAMLRSTSAELTRRGVRHQAHATTVQGFRERWDGVSWDVAQATFSLQSLTPEERRETLGWLRKAAKRVVLAEFDVPAFDQQLGPTRVKHIAKRYERGLAEYDGDGGQVAQGFLMPVFFGYFDPTVSRTNYEQPMATWLQELREAGFAEVRQTPVYDYWWAPACLLDAR